MRPIQPNEKSGTDRVITPLHDADQLSETFDMDIDLRIKRDDLYLMPGGGIKARKIEGIAKYALENGYNALVTNGGTQSNHARATAIIAALHNLPCHLVIVLEPGEKYANTGNILLMQLSGASIEYCEKSQLAERMDSAVERLSAEGYKPLYIWGGGHCVQGIIPFVDAIEEFRLQAGDWVPDFLISASATGTTQAGFAIGCAESNTRVIGISAARDKNRGEKIILRCVDEYFEYLNLPGKKIDIDFRDEWTLGGYEKYSDRLFQIIEMAAKKGFFFDPTYSGKAFNGLVDMVHRDEIPGGSKVLFWHTGGLMNLMAVRRYLDREILL